MSDAAPGWVANSVSALNGFFGDYLLRRGNGLAIGMAFYVDNQPLTLSAETIKRVYPQAGNKLCIFVHGLACNESVWTWHEPVDGTEKAAETAVSYGSLLHDELGYTPFFLRYNSGLSIAKNGSDLALLLTSLVASYPHDIEEIMLIGHSMGGLVLRSACHHASQLAQSWVSKVSRVFYLGTPHSGADLEKFVHISARTLTGVKNPITRLIGDILNLRSQGVKDLRNGALLPDNEMGEVEWLPSAQHYFIMGTLTSNPANPVSKLLGDVLVRVPNELPQALGSATDGSHLRVFAGTHHLALAHDREVYRQIKTWCST